MVFSICMILLYLERTVVGNAMLNRCASLYAVRIRSDDDDISMLRVSLGFSYLQHPHLPSNAFPPHFSLSNGCLCRWEQPISTPDLLLKINPFVLFWQHTAFLRILDMFFHNCDIDHRITAELAFVTVGEGLARAIAAEH